jgi:hypothetical protein
MVSIAPIATPNIMLATEIMFLSQSRQVPHV